jgi:hypothetical protein
MFVRQISYMDLDPEDEVPSDDYYFLPSSSPDDDFEDMSHFLGPETSIVGHDVYGLLDSPHVSPGPSVLARTRSGEQDAADTWAPGLLVEEVAMNDLSVDCWDW